MNAKNLIKHLSGQRREASVHVHDKGVLVMFNALNETVHLTESTSEGLDVAGLIDALKAFIYIVGHDVRVCLPDNESVSFVYAEEDDCNDIVCIRSMQEACL